MEFIRLEDTKHPYWSKAWKVYETSFPVFEQRLIKDQIEAMKDKQFKPMVIEDAGEFVGILFYWEWEKCRYVEHFAIDQTLRGKNYGSKAIESLCKEAFITILEIDPPIDEVSKKRLEFYKKAGFEMNNYEHHHPPYRKGYKGHELCVLSYKQKLPKQTYDTFKMFLNNQIMQYAE